MLKSVIAIPKIPTLSLDRKSTKCHVTDQARQNELYWLASTEHVSTTGWSGCSESWYVQICRKAKPICLLFEAISCVISTVWAYYIHSHPLLLDCHRDMLLDLLSYLLRININAPCKRVLAISNNNHLVTNKDKWCIAYFACLLAFLLTWSQLVISGYLSID